MLAPCPMDSYMETWVSLCGTVCVFQSPCLWYHTMIKCVHASVHVFMSTQLPVLAQPPMDSYMQT